MTTAPDLYSAVTAGSDGAKPLTAVLVKNPPRTMTLHPTPAGDLKPSDKD